MKLSNHRRMKYPGLPLAFIAGVSVLYLMAGGTARAQSDVTTQSMPGVNASPLSTGSAPTPLSMSGVNATPLSMTPLSGTGGGAGGGGNSASGLSASSSKTGYVQVNHNLPAIPVASPNQLPQGDLSLSRPGEAQAGQINAQTSEQWDSGEFTKLDESLRNHAAISPPSTQVKDLKTLFFTAWQYALLNEARELWHTRPPGYSERNNPDAPKPSGPREISLGGISYRNAKDWTVWLNSQRIKPDAIPKEVLDIKVSSDHIDLKWFDNATNLIFPIRLHPHERFNLDDRIFLPGAGT
jgi:hypothetical protein